MCRDPNKQKAFWMTGCAAQSGFSIVSAIFLLVVLAALGAFMVTISTVQHTTSTQDLQGARAYQAARAGIEWGSYQILQNASCPASTPLAFGGTLAGFAVTVQCISAGWTYTEGGNNVTVYRVISTANQGTVGSATYVERQLQVTIGK